jgi:hypothetical protein
MGDASIKTRINVKIKVMIEKNALPTKQKR